jgi:hypothetical protein
VTARDDLFLGDPRHLIDQPEPPSAAAIRRAVGMREARARFESIAPEVFVRIGRDGHGEGGGSAYFVDLGNHSGQAIAIRDQGRLAVDRPAVHFRRPVGLLPLRMLSRDGLIDRLRSCVNLTEADFRLMVTWLTAVLRPVGSYPILVLNGEQSTAKSTLVKALGRLAQDHRKVWARTAPARPQLRLHGLNVGFERRNERRFVTLTSEHVPIAAADTRKRAIRSKRRNVPEVPVGPIIQPTCYNCI